MITAPGAKRPPALGAGDDLEEMGDRREESELIDVVERRFVAKQVRRQKYRCRCGHIEAALGPSKLRGARRYSPEFAIEVATNKYLDHLPLTRQARWMERQGLQVSSQTLWDQLNRLDDHVESTYLGICEYIRSADVLGMGETTGKMVDLLGSTSGRCGSCEVAVPSGLPCGIRRLAKRPPTFWAISQAGSSATATEATKQQLARHEELHELPTAALRGSM